MSQYVPAVDLTAAYYKAKLIDPSEYDYSPYLTNDVVNCAKVLVAAYQERMKLINQKLLKTFDLTNVLAVPRMLLSDALREAGCDEEAIHWHLAHRSITIAECILYSLTSSRQLPTLPSQSSVR